MTFLIIITILCFAIAALCSMVGYVKGDGESFLAGNLTVFFMAIGIAAFLGLIGCYEDSSPKAIDVYKGKTTLQITYQDSVAIDSVVVWKDEYDPQNK